MTGPRELDDDELAQELGETLLKMIDQSKLCPTPALEVTTGVTIDGVLYEVRVKVVSS